MKKTIFCLLLFLIMLAGLLSGTLREAYQKGIVKLEADPDFARNCDWKKLFGDYQVVNEFNQNPIGTFRNLGIAPDGSVFVSNYAAFSFYKFAADGSFLFHFGDAGRRTSPDSPINRRPSLGSILDGRFLLTYELQGRMVIYDLDGREQKKLQFDYDIRDCEALRDNVLAVVGWVLWKGRSVKHRIALKDIASGEESAVRELISADDFKGTVMLKLPNGCMLGFSSAASSIHAFARRTPEGDLVTGFSNSPEIAVFSHKKQLLRQFKLNITPQTIPAAEKEEYFQKSRQQIDKIALQYKLPAAEVEKAKQSLTEYPTHKPFFYSMLVDPEGNILVFPYIEKEGQGTAFQVYSPSGEFICESSFVADGYLLHFNGGRRRVAFFGNHLYALAEKKEGGKAWPQLVRFRID